MSVYSDFQKFVNDLETSSTFKNWCSLHAADCATWKTYRTGLLNDTPSPSAPAISTNFGKALVDVGIMAVAAGLVAPPPLPPLAAAFTYAINGLTVTFADRSQPGPSGPIVGYHWDFGDGATSTAQNPFHTYGAAGTYNVVLTVTGTAPDGTANVTHPLTVTSVGPGSIRDQFIALTNWSRPTTLAGTPSGQRKPWTTVAQLLSLLQTAVSGDYLYYAGVGILNAYSASGNPLRITDINPSGKISVDFGTRSSIWDPSQESGNYTEIGYNGTSLVDAMVLDNCSNINFYGGSWYSSHHFGPRVFGNTHDILWYDGYAHDLGGTGLELQPITISGATSTITRIDFRFEINRYAMDPSKDNHPDKGTGFHGCQIHGNSGHFDDNRVVVYPHDSLKPGEHSWGQTWPEGGGGGGLEPGTDMSGGATSQNGNTYACYAENLLMICNGTNPGSKLKQTGGNAVECWGNVPLNNTEFLFIGGVNLTGQNFHGVGGNWHPGTPPAKVDHGRHSNTNQAYPLNGLSSATDPYDRRWGVVFNDCT